MQKLDKIPNIGWLFKAKKSLKAKGAQMKNKRTLLKSMACMAIALAMPAYAQELESVSEARDWTVFVDPSNPQHCYIATSPSSSRAVRNGEEVDVNRGTVRLFVGIKNGATEPSFRAGYPLAGDAAVAVKIGSTEFSYLTNPNANAEYAWPQPQNDSAIINAMKAGSTVEVTARSQRGTTTVDNFSLSGFTAAYNAAAERCR